MSLADRCAEILDEIDATIGVPDELPEGWVAVPISESVSSNQSASYDTVLDEPAKPKLHPNIFENIDAALSSFVIVREVS